MTSNLPPLVQALSGSVGSASAATLTYPLDLITTRLQLDSPQKAKRRGGIRGGLRLLLFIVYGSKRKQRRGLGWGALYDGLRADLSASMLSNFFYFYFYSFLRSVSTNGLSSSITIPALRRLLGIQEGRTQKPHKPTLLEDLVLGFVAGVASRAVSTPLGIITLRLQAEAADTEDEDSDSDGSMSPVGSADGRSQRSPSPVPKIERSGIVNVARLIYEEEGLKGFWKGFGTSALLSLNPSITLAFFQLFRKAVVFWRRRTTNSHGSSNLRPLEAFFVGAIANSIASTILYPLILAKKRLQSGAGTTPNATLFSVLKDAYLGSYDPHAYHDSVHGQDTNPTATSSGNTSRPPLLPTRPSLARRSKSSYYAADAPKMEGMEGLYQGLQMQILKGFFNQGMTFLVKGRIEQLVVETYLRRLQAGVESASS